MEREGRMGEERKTLRRGRIPKDRRVKWEGMTVVRRKRRKLVQRNKRKSKQ